MKQPSRPAATFGLHAAISLSLLIAIWPGTPAQAAKRHDTSRSERLDACVSEHDPVTLSGEIHRKRYRGASQDVDSYARDRADTAVILKLSRPLCVMLPDDVDMTPHPHSVREVQLLADERLPKSSDTKRQIEGTIQLAQTRYHHLPVLLEVKELGEGFKPTRQRHRSDTR
jgi:hypothetical protein